MKHHRCGLLAGCALAPACAFDAGQGFATMIEGELHMALEISEERELGDGAFMTDHGYRIEPRELSVEVEHIVLFERAEQGASPEPIEPAVCHGDHCHAEDGSLVDIDDHGDEHEAGSEAALSPLVEVHLDRSFDVLEAEDASLTEFEPSAELPETRIEQIEIELTELRLRATVEGGQLTEPIELEIELALDVPLTKAVSLAIDRDGPEELALHVTVHLDATALDGLDLASLADDGALVIDGDSPESAALIEWLERAEVDVTF
jgi:hypothetical protein